MIFDKNINLIKYKNLFKNLDIVIDYLQNNDLAKLPEGKYRILDERVYVNIINASLVKEDDTDYEYHKKYLDLHVEIEGEEIVKYCDLDSSTLIKIYDGAVDYGLVRGTETGSCVLSKDYFTICMPEEPHKPLIISNKNRKVKKAIFKILVEDE